MTCVFGQLPTVLPCHPPADPADSRAASADQPRRTGPPPVRTRRPTPQPTPGPQPSMWAGIVPDGLLENTEPLILPSRVRPQGGGTQDTPDEALFAAIVCVLVGGCAWGRCHPVRRLEADRASPVPDLVAGRRGGPTPRSGPAPTRGRRPSRRDPDRALLRPTSTKPHSVVDLPPLREQGRAPSRSWTEAAMTGTTKSRLRASTAVCRLRPHLLVGVPPSVDDGGGLGRRGPTTSRSRLRSAR